jgi:transcriptional regulator with XRE-family HTH domain
MIIGAHLTDDAVLGELGQRLSRLRLERNLSQAQLGEEAGVGRRTLQRLEAGEPVQLSSLIRVLRVLGLLESLDRLVSKPTPSPLERLQLAGRERRRARRRGAGRAEDRAGPWKWGDETGGR